MATSGDISSAAAKRKPLTGVAEFIQSFRLFFIGEPGERPWFNLLLVFVPLSIASRIAEWSPTAQFVLSLFAMMPLAERLGFTTESLADHTNDTIGGLMNATMGNLPELIVALFALKDGLLRVVQTSLLGSILSNLLLVMGMAYLVGGIRYKEQTFNKIQTHTGSALLIVSVIAMILPAVLQATNTEAVEHQSELNLSRAVSIVMILTYIALMVFQLRTHAHLYNDADDDDASTATGTAAGGEEGEAQSLVHAAEAGLVVEDCAVADSDKPSRTVDSAITSTNTAASMVTSASDDVTASCHATIAIKAPVVDSSSSSSSSDGVLDSPTASVVVDVEAAATTPLAPVPDAAAAASRGASSRSLGAAAGTGLQSARAVSAASAGASTGAEAVAAGRQNEAASSVVAATPHHDGPPLSVFSSIFWMAAVAALIAGLSEIIVASIEQFAQQTGERHAQAGCSCTSATHPHAAVLALL